MTYEGEVGFENGWSSLWRHNQIPLALRVSDKPDLTESKVLKDPAGNISLDADRGLYVLMGGMPVTTHMSITLPKGFRFTGYRIVMLNDMNGKSFGGFTLASISKRMYETNSSFNYSSSLASTAVMSGNNDSKEYVIERTSKTEADMGNNLYFYFWRESDNYYGATIKSIELYFTAEAEFEEEGVPGAPHEIISNGVNMVGDEFTTGKLDLGVLQPNTKSGSTYYSYDYENVIDLTAMNWLYQENAVTADKKLPATPGSGNIQVLQNDGQLYYALGNGTYYIETPTETTNQNGKTIPLGYRITGATINAHYGTKASSSTVNYDSKTGTISYKTGGVWSTTYYLQTDGTWKTSPVVHWTLTKTNKLQSGQYYLSVQKYTQYGRVSYIANGTTDINAASAFTINNSQVKYGDLYLSRYNNERARFYTNNNYAATWTANQGSTTNPAYTPSAFKLTLFGTSASEIEEMANVSSTNKNAQVTVSGLNNDAVKFTISGLADGSKALITYNLKMQQLNPFINSLDIVCHSKKADGLKITQQFTSNDFQVAGGEFLFYVPSDFVGDDNKCKFTFENLTSKYMDDTYGKGTTGNARNFLVKSAYYNTYGDGKQYTALGNEEATTKVSTEMCGDKPFTFNNAADLEASGAAATASTLEEYPYSEALYRSQGGTFTSDIELAINQEKECYLFAGDETRYNIAPTTGMEHRYYAYYLMDIKLLVKDYDAQCHLTELYNSTCYDGDQEKPMYGGVFKAYDKETKAEIPSQSAYLTVNMMKQALVKALEEKGATTDQVLYLDYTNLYSVLVESKESMAEMKNKLNPNCLIFFPERTFFDEDNYVQKTMSGGYLACKNIVITDKQPFYTPYKITVPAENYATYTRKITVPLNGKVALATIVLPFSLEMQDGVHTNATEDGCSFSLHQLKPSNCLAISDDEAHTAMNYHGKAGFDKIDLQHTIPNAPYLVKVENAPEDAQVSFIATQYGSDVLPTKGGDGETFMPMDETDYTFKGETGEGTIGSANYSFVNYGSYSGRKLDKKTGWFYFAGGMFLNSKNLAPGHDYVYMYPFRAYFAYSCTDQSKLMTAMEVSFDDNTATGISIVGEDVGKGGLTITSGNSSLTLYAGRDASVVVASATGTLVGRYSMKQGDRKTLSLPSGLYVVNGNKVVVK
ncbi:MAG: hypothetical protein PUF32_04160 [Prevotella sp.]|nr:hypothetical protein [Prevotella sp.]